MSAGEIIAMIQLAQVLVPEAAGLLNNIVSASKSEGSLEDKMKALIDLQGALKPMVLK